MQGRVQVRRDEATEGERWPGAQRGIKMLFAATHGRCQLHTSEGTRCSARGGQLQAAERFAWQLQTAGTADTAGTDCRLQALQTGCQRARWG